MTARPFIKMHGLGNDFVVIDARREPLALDAAAVRAVADRRAGVGCDQLIVMEPASNGAADVFMRIRNADGGEVEACGNATRCVASLIMAETGRDRCTVETRAGALPAVAARDGAIAVDMGAVRTAWREIPLARQMDTLHLELTRGPLRDPVAVNIGNPHAVFFVDDAAAIDLAGLGPSLEHDPVFPERANIGVAEVVGPDRLRVRVWERGVGLTRACGTGACAAAAAAHRRGLTGRKVEVRLDGGPLALEWREDGHMVMTGPVATSFTGVFAPSLLS
ncbi:MAG: diaminopimelate epimerase [Kiloniellales bacterium]|jgi:diaminopimelate epimerase|nr:diaminopimelate epimerase [Kiloniellales bacterium]